MKRGLPICGITVLAMSGFCVELPKFSASVVNEIETARTQMGRIDDDTPHWQIIAYPEVSFAHIADVGMMLYTDTRLSDRRDSTLRRAFYETDYFPYFRWNLELAEGWFLRTQPQMGFSYVHHSREMNQVATSFYGDFRWTETLETPHVTMFVYFRKIYDPDSRMNGHIGVLRKFKLSWYNLKITPLFLLFFGNAEENAMRYGLDPAWNGENRHSAGFSSVMPGVSISRRLNDWLSCFISFKELVVVGQEYRDTLSKRSRPVNYCDYAIFSIGMVVDF